MNLDIVEKADLPILRSWFNDLDSIGEFEPISQETLGDLEKQYDNLGGGQWFFVEKKDGTKIGYIAHFKSKGCVGIGYILIPKERRKGYGSEAVQIMVDYLFLAGRSLEFRPRRIRTTLHRRRFWKNPDSIWKLSFASPSSAGVVTGTPPCGVSSARSGRSRRYYR